MKSYASIDRVEGDLVVCEVELCTIEDSKPEDYAIKETVMIDIPITMFLEIFREGDIFVVEHDCESVSAIIYKDDGEKQRRIDIIQKFIPS